MFEFNKYIIERDYRDRGIYSRVLYLDNENNRYIKVWNKSYFYKPFFDQAYKSGFYNDNTLITQVLDDGFGGYLGYVTEKCQPVTYATVDKNKLNELIDRVAAKCFKYNMVYIDSTIDNIVEKDGKYYKVDLEPVIPIDKLHMFSNLQEILSYNNYDYLKKIQDLLPGNYFSDLKIRKIKNHTYNQKPIKYGTANGRIFLEKEYLPSLDGRVLFVGVNYYTDFYPQLVKKPNLFETLDVSETVIEHGSPHGHYVGNIVDFEADPDCLYDHVCFFGIIGHPDEWDILKQKEEIIKCIKVLDSLVKRDGTLLLGPATVTLTKEWWDEIYNLDILKKYKLMMLKKIDINYIWRGQKP